jgi:mono/diheme cytochrome c family protein
MKRLLSILVLGLILAAAGARAGGDAVAGRKVAIENCSRCHVIGDYNRLGGIDSTPWFMTFARKPAVYPPGRLRTFSERPPHPQLRIDLSERERDDLVAYIESLRPE